MKKMILFALILVLIVALVLGTVFFSRYWGNSSAHEEALSANFEGGYKLSFLKPPLPYRLFIPQGYDETKEYPLFLFLSSGMGQGYNNIAQLERGAFVLVSDEIQSIQPCFVLAPQCPPYSQWLNTSFKSMPFKNYNQDDIPESLVMKQVVELIHHLEKKYNIDSNRLYVTGDSMGSSGTWDIITRYPHLFAAAFTSSGVSDPEKAHLVASMPIWAFHGTKDKVSDVNNSRNMVKKLRDLGSDCLYTEFEESGHGIPQVYQQDGLFPWVFSQVLKKPVDMKKR